MLMPNHLNEIVSKFNAEFATSRISLSREQIAQRGRGKINKAGWAIWYLFGSDEKGEFLDYYAAHRMTNDRHERIRANGETEALPTIQDMRVCSSDPQEDARLETESLANDQEVHELLRRKGFGLTEDEPGGVQIRRAEVFDRQTGQDKNKMGRGPNEVAASGTIPMPTIRLEAALVRSIEFHSEWSGLAPPCDAKAFKIEPDGKEFKRSRSGSKVSKPIRTEHINKLLNAIANPVLSGEPPTIGWTDDFPTFRLTVLLSDGNTIVAKSESQHDGMVPWEFKVGENGEQFTSYSAEVGPAIARLLPPRALNRERLASRGKYAFREECAMTTYDGFCETLWRNWVKGPLDDIPEFISTRFELDHAPEPYVQYGTANDALCVLLTNPGQGMSHQKHSVVMAGTKILNSRDSYATAATKLGRFYHEELPKKAARSRIEKMMRLAKAIGKDGVRQLECIPFHSKSLPSKHNIIDYFDACRLLGDYLRELEAFLRDKTVLAVTAAPARQSLSRATVTSSRWLSWLAELLGISVVTSEFIPTVRKDGKVTAALILDHAAGNTKAIHLMMGSNNLPSGKGLERIAQRLG